MAVGMAAHLLYVNIEAQSARAQQRTNECSPNWCTKIINRAMKKLCNSPQYDLHSIFTAPLLTHKKVVMAI